MGSATSIGTVQIAFDLLKDYPLDRINVVLNAPNRFWGFKEFTVKYRSEAVEDYYYIAAKHVKVGTDLNYSVNIPMNDKKARFIVIDIKRSHAFQHIPLSEIQIYKGTGEEGQHPAPALTAEQMRAELKKDGMMVDKYGQWIYETWPGKVTSDAQLRQEYAAEAEALADVTLDPAVYDRFGGIKSGGRYAGTGYFRLQQIDNKWWFITPDGYKFILKGVDATSIWEWGYGTPIYKADGVTPRRVFEELPDPAAYARAYANDANGERVSFVIANVMKKYGEGFEAKWEDITKKRLISWGFNAFSKWTKPGNITFPYIHVLQDPTALRRIQWTYDVFDPQAPAVIEAALSGQLEKAKSDPWLIGYTYDNEAGWNADIVREILTYPASSPAKSAFVDFLAPRYDHDIAEVNRLLGTNAESFDALKNVSIAIAAVPAADVSDYIKLASRTYFSTVRNIIKKYDANHLFLGSSIVPTWRTSLDWDSAAMEFVDAFSVDNYANDASWISRYEAYGKPLLNLEYTFSTTQRGLSPVNAATSVPEIEDRGEAFEAFVESQVAHPLFVGSGWFSYFDQAVTGRRDGENFNIGLVNQQDQPYTDMVNIMKTVNAGLERIHALGSIPPAAAPIKIEAESYSSMSGVIAETTSDEGGGQNIGSLQPGDWVAYNGVNLSGMTSIDFRYASVRTGMLQVRLGSPTGTIIGTLGIASTGGWQTWTTSSIPITPVAGVQNLYFTFERPDAQPIGNLNYFVIVPGPDSTAPRIVIGGVEDGQSYTDSVIPSAAAGDDGSGLKSFDVKLNGEDWTIGEPVTARGDHTLTVTAVDHAGNEAVETVSFKLYRGTKLQAEPATAVYGGTAVLNAELTDSLGAPVSGETIVFSVEGTAVGTALTDAQGRASLEYRAAVGAAPDADTASYEWKASLAQNDASYYRGAEGASLLTVTKSEATVSYVGSTAAQAASEFAAAARVTPANGAGGGVEALPVVFIIGRVQPDGSVSEATSAASVTDATGVASAPISLPAGLYEIRTELQPNRYYKQTDTTVTAVVYEAGASFRMNGWLPISTSGREAGGPAEKLMIEADWGYVEDGSLQGKMKLHVEPKGLQLEAISAEWLIVTDSFVFLQATAQDKAGETYTVRIAASIPTASRGGEATFVSAAIWSGTPASGEPLLTVSGRPFHGNVSS